MRGCGNIHLKGKKHKLLSCMCCEVNDEREQILAKLSKRESDDESALFQSCRQYQNQPAEDL